MQAKRTARWQDEVLETGAEALTDPGHSILIEGGTNHDH
jgi:hypothetical protein